MPSKRRVTVDSDSDDELLHSSPASKRPRTTQPDDADPSNDAPHHPDAEEEIRFEEENEGIVMEQILDKKQQTIAGVRPFLADSQPRS